MGILPLHHMERCIHMHKMQVPDYYEHVKFPMDFSTMYTRLSNGFYLSFEAFASDFDLICDNCMGYNKPDTVFHKQAAKLKELGHKLIDAAKAKWEGECASCTTTRPLCDKLSFPTGFGCGRPVLTHRSCS
jgi:hypothetical protein